MKNIVTRKINLKPQPHFNEDCIVFFHFTAKILQRFYASEQGLLITLLYRKTKDSEWILKWSPPSTSGLLFLETKSWFSPVGLSVWREIGYWRAKDS